MTKFSKTVPVVDFMASLGASKLDIIRNPQNGGRFFTVPGTEVESGHVSSKIEKLSRDLYVSWIEGINEKTGEPFACYSLHLGNSTNVEDSLDLSV